MTTPLDVFFVKGSIYEGRAISKNKEVPNSVFYASNAKDFYNKAKEFDTPNYKAVYFILNPVFKEQPAKFAKLKKASSAEDIVERRWILIDCDPIRPEEFKHYSATDKEKKAAELLADKTYELLSGLNYRGLVIADSGNGYHILVPIKLPNTAVSKNKVQSFLKGIAARVQAYSPGAKIDVELFDAGRLCKVYGTQTRKGAPSKERPHRISGLINSPDSQYNEEAAVHNVSSLERTLRLWNTLDLYMKDKVDKPLTTVERAIRYIQKEEPAVQGANGSSKCLHVAMVLVEGFGIDNWEDFKTAISEWNQSCKPPWNDKELRHKFDSALKKRSPSRVGYLNKQTAKEDKKLRSEQLLNNLPLQSLKSAIDAAQTKTSATIPVVNECGYYYYNPNDEDTQPATLVDVARECKELKWLWKDWLMENIIHIIAADPKVGKTRFVADIIRRIQHRINWPDGSEMLEVDPQARFLMVLADGNHAELASTAVEFGIDPTCIYFPAPKKDPFRGRSLDSLEDWIMIDEWLSIIQPKFLVLDTVTYVTGKNLNTPEEAIRFINPLQELVQKHGVTVLCLCHTNLRGEALGRRLTGAARIMIKIEKPEEEEGIDEFTEKDIIEHNKRLLYVSATNFREPPYKLEMEMKTEGIEYEKTSVFKTRTEADQDKDSLLIPVEADPLFSEEGQAYYEPGKLRALPVPGKKVPAIRLPSKLKEGTPEADIVLVEAFILKYLSSLETGVNAKTLREHTHISMNQTVTENTFYKVLYKLAEEKLIGYTIYSSKPEEESDRINFWQIIGVKNAKQESTKTSPQARTEKSSGKKTRTKKGKRSKDRKANPSYKNGNPSTNGKTH